jgi:hypothetical protein
MGGEKDLRVTIFNLSADFSPGIWCRSERMMRNLYAGKIPFQFGEIAKMSTRLQYFPWFLPGITFLCHSTP